MVELDARVDHLLLTKLRELIGTQCVFVIGQESIVPGEFLHIGLELLDHGFVQLGLGLLYRQIRYAMIICAFVIRDLQ